MHLSRIALAGFALVALPALASNFSFMRRSPMSEFTAEDTRIFETTLSQLLDDPTATGAHDWNNPRTPSGGTITIVPDTSLKENCRRLKVANHSRTLKSETEYVLCKNQGKWGLSAP